MQFDSHLVIMASNATPDYLAQSAGNAKEAILDRLCGTRSICKVNYGPLTSNYYSFPSI